MESADRNTWDNEYHDFLGGFKSVDMLEQLTILLLLNVCDILTDKWYIIRQACTAKMNNEMITT